MYIRVPSLTDPRIEKIWRVCTLNRGDVPIVLFDESSKKYSILKGAAVRADDGVISRLKTVFSNENVIFK